MKTIMTFFFVFLAFSSGFCECDSSSAVAKNFMDEYVSYCNVKSDQSVKDWLKNNKLVSEKFITAYSKLVDDAWKNDPEMGLGFDPIFDAQDYPDKGFEVESCETDLGLVTLKGSNWSSFKVVVKLILVDGNWIVDGAGVINIPEEKRAAR